MRFFFMSAKRFLVVTALLFFACHSLCAQTNNGGITGSILDSSGAAIADAQVGCHRCRNTHRVHNNIHVHGRLPFWKPGFGSLQPHCDCEGIQNCRSDGRCCSD